MTNSLGIQPDTTQLRGVVRAINAAAAVNIADDAIARDIRLAVLADVDERFNSAPDAESGGVVYGGVYWPPLSESYLKQHPERYGGQILRDTGELQQSFTGNGQVFEKNFQEVIIGTALPKARGLHFGVFWGQEIPEFARPIIFVHDQLADDVMEIVAVYVERALNQP